MVLYFAFSAPLIFKICDHIVGISNTQNSLTNGMARELLHAVRNYDESQGLSFQVSDLKFQEMQKLEEVSVKILFLFKLSHSRPSQLHYLLNLEWCLYLSA